MSVLHPSTLRQTATHRRAIQARFDMSIAIDDSVSGSFACALLPPKNSSLPSSESDPRSAVPPNKFWWRPNKAPTLGVGHRIEEAGVLYELITQPRAMRAGPRTYGFWADVLPVDVLYPFDAVAHPLGKPEEPELEFKVAIWQGSGTDRVTGRAVYQEPQGAAPPEHWQALRGMTRNLRLVVGDRTFAMSGATLNRQTFAVALQLTTGDDDGPW